MEHINQLKKWQEQLGKADPDSQADMDVAARLVRHGIEALAEIERLTEGLKIASIVVANNRALIAEQNTLAAERQEWALKLQGTINEHRNAAMEADLRTQAAVRGEKQALAEVERLRARLEVAFLTCNQPEAIACDFTITRHPCGTEDFTCGCEQMMTRLKTPNTQVQP